MNLMAHSTCKQNCLRMFLELWVHVFHKMHPEWNALLWMFSFKIHKPMYNSVDKTHYCMSHFLQILATKGTLTPNANAAPGASNFHVTTEFIWIVQIAAPIPSQFTGSTEKKVILGRKETLHCCAAESGRSLAKKKFQTTALWKIIKKSYTQKEKINKGWRETVQLLCTRWEY